MRELLLTIVLLLFDLAAHREAAASGTMVKNGNHDVDGATGTDYPVKEAIGPRNKGINMPRQETFLNAKNGGETIEILKTYVEAFAREAFRLPRKLTFPSRYQSVSPESKLVQFIFLLLAHFGSRSPPERPCCNASSKLSNTATSA